MGWDHNEDIIPGSKIVTPPLDQAVTAFLEDVHQRGLTDDILLVITREFGRTPYMKGTGRDHWPEINIVVFAEGGLKMGQVIGESDKRGGSPRTPRRAKGPDGHDLPRAGHRPERAVRPPEPAADLHDRGRETDRGTGLMNAPAEGAKVVCAARLPTTAR
jgi:hypothetical protein